MTHSAYTQEGSGDRKGFWMTTHKGNLIWPLDPREGDMDIEEIAHTLANMCRWGSRPKRFYSVAEHCVLGATEVVAETNDPEQALWFLLHEVAEALWGVDLPLPVKTFFCPEWDKYEDLALAAMLPGFGLDGAVVPDSVKSADRRMALTEKIQLKETEGVPAESIDMYRPYDVVLPCWKPETAKARFLEMFDALQRHILELKTPIPCVYWDGKRSIRAVSIEVAEYGEPVATQLMDGVRDGG